MSYSRFCGFREIHDPLFLDAINSLLVAGEYPHLFSNDELEGLLQVRYLLSSILTNCTLLLCSCNFVMRAKVTQNFQCGFPARIEQIVYTVHLVFAFFQPL